MAKAISGANVTTATSTAEGVVELATDAEIAAGTDASRAITPAGYANATGTALGNAYFNSTFGVTNNQPRQPWIPADPIGPELWATANFQSGTGRNSTTLTPSLTANGTEQTLKTRVYNAGYLPHRIVFTPTLPTNGWFKISLLVTDQDGALVTGATEQLLISSACVNWPAGRPYTFEWQPTLGGSQPIGTNYAEIQMKVWTTATSGTLALADVSLRSIAYLSPPMYVSGLGAHNKTVTVPLLDPGSDRPSGSYGTTAGAEGKKLVAWTISTEGALDDSVMGLVGYNRWDVFGNDPDPECVHDNTAAVTGNVLANSLSGTQAGDYVTSSLRINNNDQIIEVQKANSSWELRGNTHGGERNTSAAVFEIDDGDGVWDTWDGTPYASGEVRLNCRRLRMTWPTTFARSAPDSDDFATTTHVTTFFPDGMMRCDRTTTFTKDMAVRTYFEWMSSHDTTVPMRGRTGWGSQVTAQMDNFEKVAQPGTLTLSTSATGGALAAATYRYQVTALSEAGETTPSVAATQATSGATSTVTVSWDAVTGATGYRIYGRANAAARGVLLATVGPGVTSWIDDGIVAAHGPRPPRRNTADRLDSTTEKYAIAHSQGGAWNVYKNLQLGICYAHIYDRDAVAARPEVGAVYSKMQSQSGIMKSYLFQIWEDAAETTTLTSGTVFTATHFAYAYIPSDPDGRWELEAAQRSANMTALKNLYPAT